MASNFDPSNSFVVSSDIEPKEAGVDKNQAHVIEDMKMNASRSIVENRKKMFK